MVQTNALRERLAGSSPAEQARAVTEIAAALRAALSPAGTPTAEADAAVDAMQRWADGEPVSGAAFSDLVYSERETGVLRRLTDADASPDKPLWNALTTAVMYVAWLAYQRSGEPMPEDVAEVDASTLDLLEDQCRSTPLAG